MFGDAANIAHFEIGNEYYGYEKFYDWSAPEQYAELAPLWAKELKAVFGDAAKVSVQGGVNAGSLGGAEAAGLTFCARARADDATADTRFDAGVQYVAAAAADILYRVTPASPVFAEAAESPATCARYCRVPRGPTAAGRGRRATQALD